MKKNIRIRAILSVLTLLLAVRTDFAFAKKSIQELTSATTSKKVAKDIPPSKKSFSNVPKGDLKRHYFGIGIGQTFLMSDFKDNGEDQITAEAFYEFSASHSFDVYANFHYSKHKYQSNYTRIAGLNGGIRAKLFQFDEFTPYALGGLGFYMPKMKRMVGDSRVSSESKVTFGFTFGGGVDLKLTDHYKVGAVFQFHNPFDVSQDTGTDVKGSYYKLLITTGYIF